MIRCYERNMLLSSKDDSGVSLQDVTVLCDNIDCGLLVQWLGRILW